MEQSFDKSESEDDEAGAGGFDLLHMKLDLYLIIVMKMILSDYQSMNHRLRVEEDHLAPSEVGTFLLMRF